MKAGGLMNYSELIKKLFTHFPMLEKRYESEGDSIKGIPHLCYEAVFVPFIKESCLANDTDKMLFICDFLELMATSEEVLVSELLTGSILDVILSDRDVIHSIKRYLGINTTKLLAVLEKERGWI